MTNYYFLQISFIYYLYNFILQSSLHLKTYMSTHKWSDYISRDSAKPALPWLTSLETVYEEPSCGCCGWKRKIAVLRAAFPGQGRRALHLHQGVLTVCTAAHLIYEQQIPSPRGQRRGPVPPPAKVQAFSPQEASLQNSDDKILTWFPPGPRE